MADRLLPPDLPRHMAATAHRITELERRQTPDPTIVPHARYTFCFDGLPSIGAVAPPVPPAFGARLYRAVAVARTGPAGAAFTFDVRVDGTVVGSGTMAAGTTETAVGFRAVDAPAGSLVDVKITGQGSTTNAEDVAVAVYGTSPKFDFGSSTYLGGPDMVFLHAGPMFARTMPPVTITRDRTVSAIETALGTNGSSALTLKLQKNGSAVHTYTHASATQSDSEVVSESFVAGDLLAVEISSGGTDAEDLSVVLR